MVENCFKLEEEGEEQFEETRLEWERFDEDRYLKLSLFDMPKVCIMNYNIGEPVANHESFSKNIRI